MNSINIVATITRDIELKYTQSGTAIAKFGIAWNDRYKKQSGEQVDKAHFFDVFCIGKKAEVISQYFSKGSKIGIQGSLNFEQWQDQQGNNRSKVNIKLNDFTFIDKRAGSQQENSQPQQQQANTQNVPEYDIDEETIPF